MGEAYFRGLAFCLSLIVAIGAQNAFVLKQGLKREHVPQVVVVCGLCDTLLLSLGVGGFGTLLAASPLLTRLAAWGGAAFLGFYAVRSFRAALRPGALVVEAAGSEAAAPVGRTVSQAAAFSLLTCAVALAHSLNANMLRKWVIDAEHAAPPRIVAQAAAPAPEVPLQGPTFIPLALTAPAVEGDIRIEVHRAGTTVNVVWPAAAARECAAWLSEWLR